MPGGATFHAQTALLPFLRKAAGKLNIEGGAGGGTMRSIHHFASIDLGIMLALSLVAGLIPSAGQAQTESHNALKPAWTVVHD